MNEILELLKSQVFILGVIGVIVVIGLFGLIVRFVRKVEPGTVGVKTGVGKLQVVTDYTLVFPIIHQYEVMDISAVTHENLRQLKYRVRQLLNELPEPQPMIEQSRIYRPLNDPKQFSIEQKDDIWLVRGREIERIIQMINWEQYESIQRLQRQLEAFGITSALKRAGVEIGDTVQIGEAEFEWL